MSKQTISLGTAPTGVGGDTPRSAFTKTQSNFDELYTALGAAGSPAALPTALPVTKGGTGNTTGTAAKLAPSAMVGTVSQSGGTPTGAIIESGSNSNGQYTKYADGTMICSHVVRMDSVLTGSIIAATWTFPMPFSNTTVHISHSPMQGSSVDCAPTLNDRFGPIITAPSGAGVSVRSIKHTAGANFVEGNFIDTHVMAKGRWFQ